MAERALTLWQPWASLCVLRPACQRCDGSGVYDTSAGLGGMITMEAICRSCRPFKTIETRSWPAPPALIGERIWVHASKRRVDGDGCEVLNEAGWPFAIPQVVYGAIVGSAVLVGCVRMEGNGCNTPATVDHLCIMDGGLMVLFRGGDWTDVSSQRPFGIFDPGRWAWLLEDAQALREPVPCRGGQRIWNVPADVAERLAA